MCDIFRHVLHTNKINTSNSRYPFTPKGQSEFRRLGISVGQKEIQFLPLRGTVLCFFWAILETHILQHLRSQTCRKTWYNMTADKLIVNERSESFVFILLCAVRQNEKHFNAYWERWHSFVIYSCTQISCQFAISNKNVRMTTRN